MEELYQMMGYFYEDCCDDYESAEAAVDAYLRGGVPTAEIRVALAQIRALLARNMSEDELYHYLGDELDCNYYTAADGLIPMSFQAYKIPGLSLGRGPGQAYAFESASV